MRPLRAVQEFSLVGLWMALAGLGLFALLYPGPLAAAALAVAPGAAPDFVSTLRTAAVVILCASGVFLFSALLVSTRLSAMEKAGEKLIPVAKAVLYWMGAAALVLLAHALLLGEARSNLAAGLPFVAAAFPATRWSHEWTLRRRRARRAFKPEEPGHPTRGEMRLLGAAAAWLWLAFAHQLVWAATGVRLLDLWLAPCGAAYNGFVLGVRLVAFLLVAGLVMVAALWMQELPQAAPPATPVRLGLLFVGLPAALIASPLAFLHAC